MLDEAVLIKKMYSLASTYMIHVISTPKRRQFLESGDRELERGRSIYSE